MMSSKQKSALICIFFALFTMIVISADCIGNSDKVQTKYTRHQVVFNHQNHMGYCVNCLLCHHRYENGKNVLDVDELSAGNPDEEIKLSITPPNEPNDLKCASCHNSITKTNKIGARDAFHRQCIGCHNEESKGPGLCGECHKRTNQSSAGK